MSYLTTRAGDCLKVKKGQNSANTSKFDQNSMAFHTEKDLKLKFTGGKKFII